MRFKIKKDQLKFFPFYVTFRGKGISKEMSNSSDVKKRMSGFTLNWFLEDINGNQITEKLPPREEDWKQEAPTPKYEEPLLVDMVQLARQLRLQNMTEDELLEEVIHRKIENVKNFEEYGMCSMNQVQPKKQKEAFYNLKLVSNVNMNKTGDPPTDKDVNSGYKLFHATFYCPVRAIKMFRFVDQLLSSESSRTIIQTFVNLFQSGAITDKTSLTLVKQFYSEAG